MTHNTDAEQPEALRVAAWLITAPQSTTIGDMLIAGRELRRLHARVQELEASQSRVPLTVQQYKDLHHQLFMKLGRKPLTDEMHLARAVEQAHGITPEKQG